MRAKSKMITEISIEEENVLNDFLDLTVNFCEHYHQDCNDCPVYEACATCRGDTLPHLIEMTIDKILELRE